MRIGVAGAPDDIKSCYEVLNARTEVVEDKQLILPNAIHQAMMFAARLEELKASNMEDFKWIPLDKDEEYSEE